MRNSKAHYFLKEQWELSSMSTEWQQFEHGAQNVEEECENFTLVLIAAVAFDFTVILHKDDTHKSTEIPLQSHSILDKQSTDARPFYGSKEPQLHCTCFLRSFLILWLLRHIRVCNLLTNGLP